MVQKQEAQPSTALRFGRHLVGMALFALLNPLIYYGSSPVTWWFGNWAFAVGASLAFFGLYALFFTERAKAAWPKSFFTLAWVLVVLVTIGPYIDKFNKQGAGAASSKSQTPTVEQTDWERGKITPPASEIDAFLADAPLTAKDAENWTQESTGSSENGPWLSHAPTGTRFCRLHDRTIVVLFPPGVRPNAEKANVFCVSDSVASHKELGFTYEEVAGKEAATGEWWKQDKPVVEGERWKQGIPVEEEWWKNGSTPVTQSNEDAHPQGLKPFTGKLDGQ